MSPDQITRHLPGDLLPEILCRIPVKSLLRFRCVSKPWLALVDTDADFARMHLKTFKHNSDQTRLVILKDGKLECAVRCSNTFEPIPDIIPPSEARKLVDFIILDSVDGLILLEPTSNKSRECSDLRVWNPSTRKMLEIPPTPGLPTSSLDYIERYFGLGYDPIAKYYKLVKLIFVKCTLDSVAIYTLGAGTWKTIKFNGNGSLACFEWYWRVFPDDKAVYFRSCLYFIMMEALGDKGWDLLWFDLSKEVFSSVRIPRTSPSFGPSDCLSRSLVSIDGGIAVEAFHMDSSYIYEWAVDSMCWNKLQLYSLNAHHISHIKKNGDMLTWRIYAKKVADKSGRVKWVIQHEVGSYSREREEHKIYIDRCTSNNVFFYVESLLLNR